MKKAVFTMEAFFKAPVACLTVRRELAQIKKLNLEKNKTNKAKNAPKILSKMSTTIVRMKPASCAVVMIFHVSHSFLVTLSIGVPPCVIT